MIRGTISPCLVSMTLADLEIWLGWFWAITYGNNYGSSLRSVLPFRQMKDISPVLPHMENGIPGRNHSCRNRITKITPLVARARPISCRLAHFFFAVSSLVHGYIVTSLGIYGGELRVPMVTYSEISDFLNFAWHLPQSSKFDDFYRHEFKDSKIDTSGL